MGRNSSGISRVAAFSDGAMIVAALAQVCVAAPIVRDDQRPLRHGALDEAAKRLCASVGGDGEPNAPGVAPVLARVLRGSGRAAAHLDGAGDESFVMNAPAFPARAAADPCLSDLDMLVCATANAIPIAANHSGAQLVEELKGGLVAREAELPLELDRGYAGSLAGDEIGGPKPDGQRRAAALHDRADSQSCLASALAACQHARTARNAERFAVRVAARADEAALPARLLEICGAGRIVGEEPLKLRQRPAGYRSAARCSTSITTGVAAVIVPSSLGARPSLKGIAGRRDLRSSPPTSPSGCMRQPDRHDFNLCVAAGRSRGRS